MPPYGLPGYILRSLWLLAERHLAAPPPCRVPTTRPRQARTPQPPRMSRRGGTGSSPAYFWLILKNVLGWALILASFVAGPLVPGPGGIPLFLIGFALVSFPGKRRLTARVLRGKPFRMPRRTYAFATLGLSMGMTALVWLFPAWGWPRWLARGRAAPLRGGPYAGVVACSVTAVGIWMLLQVAPHAMNLALGVVARARHRFRPWLRRHRIRLLPPRWRPRLPHERGHEAFRLKDEILAFTKRRRKRQ